jgi:hypothetical protein
MSTDIGKHEVVQLEEEASARMCSAPVDFTSFDRECSAGSAVERPHDADASERFRLRRAAPWHVKAGEERPDVCTLANDPKPGSDTEPLDEERLAIHGGFGDEFSDGRLERQPDADRRVSLYSDLRVSG